ncbi:Hypothetical predicted protein [Pelobates cultripes]|uniref:Uncharacterized protein n=1 Tax=Pelobates cultripes TaxID=61616 RepID=A0AAD1WVN0_PELCU|nr:Hypothetical predicted protein [Pelobates cultripes]
MADAPALRQPSLMQLTWLEAFNRAFDDLCTRFWTRLDQRPRTIPPDQPEHQNFFPRHGASQADPNASSSGFLPGLQAMDGRLLRQR